MFDVGFQELLLVFVIGLLILGPERLPKVAAQVGRWVGRARRMANQLRYQLEREIAMEEFERSRKPPKEPADSEAAKDSPAEGSPAEASPADEAASPAASEAARPERSASDAEAAEAGAASEAEAASPVEPGGVPPTPEQVNARTAVQEPPDSPSSEPRALGNPVAGTARPGGAETSVPRHERSPQPFGSEPAIPREAELATADHAGDARKPD